MLDRASFGPTPATPDLAIFCSVARLPSPQKRRGRESCGRRKATRDGGKRAGKTKRGKTTWTARAGLAAHCRAALACRFAVLRFGSTADGIPSEWLIRCRVAVVTLWPELARNGHGSPPQTTLHGLTRPILEPDPLDIHAFEPLESAYRANPINHRACGDNPSSRIR